MSVDRTTKANPSLQWIAESEAIGSEDEASRSVSFTIPLHISVRLSSTAAHMGHEAVITSEPTQTTSIINVQNPRSALVEGPLTFRDHFLSLYQSAVADLAGRLAADKKSRLESTASGLRTELISAAEVVAQRHAGGASLRVLSMVAGENALEKMSVPDHASACASLALQLMQAKVLGDTATAARLEGELDAGTCDPRWAQTITEYAK